MPRARQNLLCGVSIMKGHHERSAAISYLQSRLNGEVASSNSLLSMNLKNVIASEGDAISRAAACRRL
jgi:hypothetical protein